MTLSEIRQQARAHLETFRGTNPPSDADELLLFLNRLRDAFPSASMSWLNDLIYGLEAAPDATLRSDDHRRRLIVFLEDCAAGRFPPVRSGKRRIA